MKKVLAMTIAFVLVVGMLAACAGSPAQETPAETAQASQAAETAQESPQAAVEGEPVTITWAVFETDNFTPDFICDACYLLIIHSQKPVCDKSNCRNADHKQDHHLQPDQIYIGMQICF